MKNLEKGERLKHYGASAYERVEQIKKDLGVEAAAAHLSRNALIDYGNMTVAGNWLRKYAIPFWSFLEGNLKRYAFVGYNAAAQLKAGSLAGVPAAAVMTGVAMARIGALYGAMLAWNNLLLPALSGDDPEEDLGRYTRRTPHITLGRQPDGSVIVLRNTGSIGDLFEWVGLNDILSHMPQVASGQIPLEEVNSAPIDLENIVSKFGPAANKLVNGLRPDFKALAELMSGRSMFPDIFNWRPADRQDIAYGVLGLQEEGRIINQQAMRPNRINMLDILFNPARLAGNAAALIGVDDPRLNAMGEVYGLREDWLKSKGKDAPTPPGQSPARYMKDAVKYDDYNSFKRARIAYLKNGGTPRGFIDSVRRMDPLYGAWNRRDLAEFAAWLNTEQRAKLDVARQYARELQATSVLWWHRAAAEDE